MTATADGRIVAAGTLNTQFRPYGLVARFLADGRLDTTFVGAGWLQIDLGSTSDAVLSVALQPDGKVLLGGRGGPSGSGTSIAVARVLP